MTARTKQQLYDRFSSGGSATNSISQIEQEFEDLIDSIGLSGTLTVAASDASNASKGRADYQCDGTADEVEINAAIAALSSDGTVMLSEGTFSIAATITVTDKCSLRGQGPDATTIQVAAATQINGITLASSAGDLVIANLTVDGNKDNQTDGSTDISQNGMYLAVGTSYRVRVQNCKVVDNYYNGIVCSGFEFTILGVGIFGNGSVASTYGLHLSSCYQAKVFGCHVGNNNTGMANRGGIFFYLADRNAIMGCSVYKNTNTGIELAFEANDNQIVGNWVSYNGLYGIDMGNGERNNINDNVVSYSEQHGIFVHAANTLNNTVMGNVSYNNGQKTANTYDGISIYDATYNIVVGNLCYDDQGSKTQRYGISEENNADYNTITNNHVRSTADMRSAGSNDIIHSNLGYVTENSGTSTLLSTQTTLAVAHGLAGTPTVINIAFREQGDNDYGRWWVSTIGSANFTLNVSADPGSSNLDFAWEAKVR